MDNFLVQNLDSLLIEDTDKIEVLILDNASTDRSAEIADEYVRVYPHIFKAIHKENRGYGSSVNLAVQIAKGRYLRILDADDWVDTREFAFLVKDLENCNADLVVNDYSLVDARTEVRRRICPLHRKSGEIFRDTAEDGWFPTMHATIFRLDFLRKAKISLLEDAFYVDEQLMILSVLHAETAVYYRRDVYQYRVGHETQSVSAKNMGIRYRDRERVIKNCLDAYSMQKARREALDRCFAQLVKNAGNHFTTLYMYVEPAAAGRAAAKSWKNYLAKEWPEISKKVAVKRRVLSILGRIGVRGKTYVRIHELLKRKQKERS